jgi:hypothetical protein
MPEIAISYEPVYDVVSWPLNKRGNTLMGTIPLPHHGDWQGLSYRQVTAIWLTCVLTHHDHQPYLVEEREANWPTVLRRCTSWSANTHDLISDPLETVLHLLVDERSRPWGTLNWEMGRHSVHAYHLPSSPPRIGRSAFNVDQHGVRDLNAQLYNLRICTYVSYAQCPSLPTFMPNMEYKTQLRDFEAHCARPCHVVQPDPEYAEIVPLD